jgi:lysophospholipase L1-like esterase
MPRTILCYGDSNTWGFAPIKTDDKQPQIKRYSRHVRWTGVLQTLLSKDYYVVEEGLNGRTTNVDYFIPPERNGKTYLPPCLYSHAPIDLVVLALGGNDLKTYFNRSPEAIKDGLAELIDIIQASKYGPAMKEAPEILILSVPIPLPCAEEYLDENDISIFNGAIEKARKLINLFAAVSIEKQCHFLDISKLVSPSVIDGLHFNEIAHRQIARMVSEIILNKYK